MAAKLFEGKMRTVIANALWDVKLRHKKVAKYAYGDVLDIGYAAKPNNCLVGDKFSSVVGMDIDTIEKYKDEKIKRNVSNYTSIVQGNAQNICAIFGPGKFDAIVALEFLEHIDFHIKFLKDCHTVLKDGGLLIISTPTPYYYVNMLGNAFLIGGKSKGCIEHVNLYAPRILNMVADQTGFDVIKVGGAAHSYIPFFTKSIMYIYRKR